MSRGVRDMGRLHDSSHNISSPFSFVHAHCSDSPPPLVLTSCHGDCIVTTATYTFSPVAVTGGNRCSGPFGGAIGFLLCWSGCGGAISLSSSDMWSRWSPWRWSGYRAYAFGKAGGVAVNQWDGLKLNIRAPAV